MAKTVRLPEYYKDMAHLYAVTALEQDGLETSELSPDKKIDSPLQKKYERYFHEFLTESYEHSLTPHMGNPGSYEEVLGLTFSLQKYPEEFVEKRTANAAMKKEMLSRLKGILLNLTNFYLFLEMNKKVRSKGGGHTDFDYVEKSLGDSTAKNEKVTISQYQRLLVHTVLVQMIKAFFNMKGSDVVSAVETYKNKIGIKGLRDPKQRQIFAEFVMKATSDALAKGQENFTQATQKVITGSAHPQSKPEVEATAISGVPKKKGNPHALVPAQAIQKAVAEAARQVLRKGYYKVEFEIHGEGAAILPLNREDYGIQWDGSFAEFNDKGLGSLVRKGDLVQLYFHERIATEYGPEMGDIAGTITLDTQSGKVVIDYE